MLNKIVVYACWLFTVHLLVNLLKIFRPMLIKVGRLLRFAHNRVPNETWQSSLAKIKVYIESYIYVYIFQHHHHYHHCIIAQFGQRNSFWPERPR